MNQLVIMPDIEKRLEAFVRIGHGIVVFPGGVGTAEEILYLAGHPAGPGQRATQPFPIVLTGPRESAAYFEHIDALPRRHARRARRRQRYRSSSTTRPRWRARWCAAWTQCATFRRRASDAYNFNWLLPIEPEFQQPFEADPRAWRALQPARDQPAHELAANLRRAFSGIVAGNVKEEGIRRSRRRARSRSPATRRS